MLSFSAWTSAVGAAVSLRAPLSAPPTPAPARLGPGRPLWGCLEQSLRVIATPQGRWEAKPVLSASPGHKEGLGSLATLTVPPLALYLCCQSRPAAPCVSSVPSPSPSLLPPHPYPHPPVLKVHLLNLSSQLSGALRQQDEPPYPGWIQA